MNDFTSPADISNLSHRSVTPIHRQSGGLEARERAPQLAFQGKRLQSTPAHILAANRHLTGPPSGYARVISRPQRSTSPITSVSALLIVAGRVNEYALPSGEIMLVNNRLIDAGNERDHTTGHGKQAVKVTRVLPDGWVQLLRQLASALLVHSRGLKRQGARA